MRASIFTMLPALTTVNTTQLAELANFLIRNRTVALPVETVQTLFRARPLLATPISSIVEKATTLDVWRQFSLLSITSGTTTVPEVITMQHLTMDTRQMNAVAPDVYKALRVLPEFSDKILLNVTQMVKRQTVAFSDLTTFQSLVVRDLLSRSYHTSDKATWLSPAMNIFLCRAYSMSLASSVAEWFDLSLPQRDIVATVFAFFMACQTTPDAESAQATIRSNYRTMHLPEPMEIDQIYGLIKDLLGKKSIDTIDEVYKVLANIGVERLQLSRKFMIERLKGIAPSLYAAAMALEYAPYFCWLIVLAASGAKIGITYKLKNANLMRDAQAFSTELATASGFLPRLV